MMLALKKLLLPQRPRLYDQYDADGLRLKYGDEARSKAVERARNATLSRRERRHWQRVSKLLKQ